MVSPGVALFNGGVLVAAGRVRLGTFADKLADGERWMLVAGSIVRWVDERAQAIQHVVFERPQWYQRAKSKGDPNQLSGIAGVAANVTGMLHARNNLLAVQSPTPAEWIGQISKVCPSCGGKAKKRCVDCKGSAWETPRGRRIRSRLSPTEIALVPDQNDAIDACGLGLHSLGRLAPKHAFSNGRDGL
jgi:hypothetical protein